MKLYEIRERDNYREYLKSVRVYSRKWIDNRVRDETHIQYDETTKSVKTLKSKSKRCGRFEFSVYQVVYNFKLEYGYSKEIRKRFNEITIRDLEGFRTEIIRIDPLFNKTWIKDKRRFGRTDRIKGFISCSKHYTSKIERIFGFKNGLYKRIKSIGMRKLTEEALSNLYVEYFKKVNIHPINF